MNEPEISSETSNSETSEVAALKTQVRSLRTMFLTTVAALLVLSGTANFLLLWQVVSTNRAKNELQPRFLQMSEQYQKYDLPLMKNFVTRLEQFSKTNPDFATVLSKYVGPEVAPGNTSPAGIPTAPNQ